MLGSWLGWASVASFLLALGNYLIRKMKCKKQFHLLRGKHHRIWGVLMTAAGPEPLKSRPQPLPPRSSLIA